LSSPPVGSSEPSGGLCDGIITAIALGGAALTPASARGFDGGWHGGGYGFRSFSYDRSYDSYNDSYESEFRFSRSRRW
jgi:hypothetical protein